MIGVGDNLPGGTLMKRVDGANVLVDFGALVKGRKIVLFGLPGAYTGTCSTMHVPSFMRVMDGLKAKGVDDVICLSVNDPFVMEAWGAATGATDAGIEMLADPASTLTKALGMLFDGAASGLIDRCQRFALYAEDGVVKVLNLELSAGVCDLSSGETMLDAI